jgi:hypothetical protein
MISAVAALIFQSLHRPIGNGEVSDVANVLYIAGLCLIGAALIALAGYALVRKGEVVKGLGFGICIAGILSVIEFGLLEWVAGV